MALRLAHFLLAFALMSLTPLLSTQAHACAKGKPHLMVAMGDSITAATLADLPIPDAGTAEERVKKWAKQGRDPKIIFENQELSWSGGWAIDSHYSKIKNWMKKNGVQYPLEVLNVAYPGNTSYDMPGEADEVVKEMSKGSYEQIDYVTILIGANDACSDETPIGTPLQTMHDNLMLSLQKIASIQQKTPIRILLVGMPRIPNLGTSEFRNASTIFGLSCETVRNKILKSCNSLLLWNTSDRYDADMLIVEDKNRLIRELASEATTKFPNLEIVYSNRLYDLAIPLNLLAIDCFHPNKLGQEGISEQTWLDQPWYE